MEHIYQKYKVGASTGVSRGGKTLHESVDAHLFKGSNISTMSKNINNAKI